jgi:MoaA/NifB/PqqE/SkfB family radical SAM enzyme
MKASYIAYKLFNTKPQEFVHRLKTGFRHYILNYPTTVIVQTVAACNLPCTHCFINNYGKEIVDGKKKIMQLDEFNKMLKTMPNIVKNASYFGFSSFEALLNKDIFEMMEAVLAINPKIKFPFLSNSMLLTEENILRLKRMPITEINISLDGLYKETVEAFKTGVDYNQIIKAIMDLQKNGMSSITAVTFVAHKDNINELPDYVNFVNSLGVKTVYVNNLMSFTGLHKHLYLYTKNGNNSAKAIFDTTIANIKQNKQTLWLPKLQPSEAGCTQPEALFINSNGDVAPCDYLAVKTPFEYFGSQKTSAPTIFGNVWQNNALSIFRNKQAKFFRKMHRNGKLPDACDHCIDGYGLMCSKRTMYN